MLCHGALQLLDKRLYRLHHAANTPVERLLEHSNGGAQLVHDCVTAISTTRASKARTCDSGAIACAKPSVGLKQAVERGSSPQVTDLLPRELQTLQALATSRVHCQPRQQVHGKPPAVGHLRNQRQYFGTEEHLHSLTSADASHSPAPLGVCTHTTQLLHSHTSVRDKRHTATRAWAWHAQSRNVMSLDTVTAARAPGACLMSVPVA